MVALAIPSTALASPRKGNEIPKYVGAVSAKNVKPFLDAVSGHLDKIVGLKVFFDSTPNRNTGYSASTDDRLFVVNYGTLDKPGVEIVAPKAEASYLHGSWVLDGFYIVKSGGVHQGTVSVGLEKVDEGAVLLSTKYHVVQKPIP